MQSGEQQAKEPEDKNPEEPTAVWSSESYPFNHGIFALSSGHLLLEHYEGSCVIRYQAVHPLTDTLFNVRRSEGSLEKFRSGNHFETALYPHDKLPDIQGCHRLFDCLAKVSTTQHGFFGPHELDVFSLKLKNNYKFSNVQVVFVFAEHPKTSIEAPSLPPSPTILCEGDNKLYLYDFSDDELYKLTGPITYKFNSENGFRHVAQEDGYLLRDIPELKESENEIFHTFQFLRFPHITPVDGWGKFGPYFETLSQGLPQGVAKLTAGYAGTWLSWFYGPPVKKVAPSHAPTKKVP